MICVKDKTFLKLSARTGGNSWSSGPAPPRSTPPGPNHRGSRKNSSKGGNSGLSGGAIAGIVISVFFAGLVVFVIAKRRRSSFHYIDEENPGQGRPFNYFDSNEFKGTLCILTYSKMSSVVDGE